VKTNNIVKPFGNVFICFDCADEYEYEECEKCDLAFSRAGPDFQLNYTTAEGYDNMCKCCIAQYPATKEI
jgi:hypothetical protein